MLDEFFHQYRDRQVLDLAVDQLSAVRAFLERRPLSFPVGLAGQAPSSVASSAMPLVVCLAACCSPARVG
jgi:hypothetical protein